MAIAGHCKQFGMKTLGFSGAIGGCIAAMYINKPQKQENNFHTDFHLPQKFNNFDNKILKIHENVNLLKTAAEQNLVNLFACVKNNAETCAKKINISSSSIPFLSTTPFGFFMEGKKCDGEEEFLKNRSFIKYIMTGCAVLQSLFFPWQKKEVFCVSPADGFVYTPPRGGTAGYKIGVVRTMWNSSYVDALVKELYEGLEDCGIKKENITLIKVPGSYELPYGAKALASKDEYDAIVCIGCLIKGDSLHFECIADAVSHGIMKAQLESNTPILFGVLTCTNLKQAEERAFGRGRHAYSWAQSAVQMAEHRRNFFRERKG